MERRPCWVAMAVTVLALVLAPGVVAPGVVAAGGDGAGDADGVELRDEVEGAVERLPASLSVSLHGGLPAYRSAGLGVALRAEQFGVALRGAWGSVGVAFGAQARWYPPLPSPLPFFLGVGVDTYVGSVTPHAVVGAHVPLATNWRLDFEGGAARASLAGNAVWAPHLSVGVSYSLAFDLPEARTQDDGPSRLEGRGGSASACVPGDPDPELLARDVDAAVRAFVREGIALYGNAYRDLRYRYAIVSERVDGDVADVRIRYSGSARARLSGELVEASGTAEASFRWTGCRWRQTDLRY